MSDQLDHYPAQVLIDSDALANNVEKLRKWAPHARHMGIVKADAYGHGIEPVALSLAQLGYDMLGVAQVSEALKLREQLDEAGFEKVGIFTWLLPHGDETVLRQALEAGLELSVSSVSQILSLAAFNLPGRIHLKVDTGMGRGGAHPDQFSTLVAAALQARESGLETVGIWSHLARADELGEEAQQATNQQIELFETAVETARSMGVENLCRHLAASSGQIWYPRAHYDMVRDGIALYGLSPDPHHTPSLELGLKPVMTLQSQLLQVKHVKAGQTVSYGGTWVAEQDTWLGLVPLGYGDGIPRHASNTGPVRVYSQSGDIDTHIVGRVCMDQFVIDLGNASYPPAQVGDKIVLFGNPHHMSTRGCPTGDDWAEASGTINYEIVTRLGSRLPRSVLAHDNE